MKVYEGKRTAEGCVVTVREGGGESRPLGDWELTEDRLRAAIESIERGRDRSR